MSEQAPNVTSQRQAKTDVSAQPTTKLFYAGVASPSADYLVEHEGVALSRIVGEANDVIMASLFESDPVLTQVAPNNQAHAREKLGAVFKSIEQALGKKDPAALAFLPRVNRVLDSLPPATLVAGLRVFLSQIQPRLSTRQLWVMSRGVMETVASVDRWAIRSKFSDETLIRTAFKNAGLQARDAEGAPFRVVKGWLSDWGSMQLTPMVADDFEFFRRLIRQLPPKEILAEDEWRGLLRALALAFPEQRDICLNDRSFALFRLISRCPRRLPFVQYLLQSHGRALDMLGPELKDWILVNTLVDQSGDPSETFKFWLQPAIVVDEAGLEADELKEFFESVTEKMSADRERFELDWFDHAWGELYSVIKEHERAVDWKQKANAKAETLASNIAADSSKKVSVSQSEQSIRHICDLVANTLTVTQRRRDAQWHMGLLVSMVVDLVRDGHIWRNGQRIAASLLNVASDDDTEFAGRLQAALETLRNQQQIQSRIDGSLGSALAQLEPRIYFFGCHLAVFHASAQTLDGARKSVHLMRDELFARRLKLTDVYSRCGDGELYRLVLSCGLEEADAKAVCAALKQQIRLASLWMNSRKLGRELSGESDTAARRVGEIARLMFMLPSELVERVDEEWAFWIAPELRAISSMGDGSEAPDLTGFEKRIKSALNSDESRRVEVFFKRILASENKKPAQTSSDLRPYVPLQLERPSDATVVSEPFQVAVDEFTAALENADAPRWLLEFADQLRAVGDEETAWLAVYPSILEALASEGHQTVSACLDRVMLSILEYLGPLGRAHWFEVLAEGRALTQQLAIGQVWLAHAGELAEMIAPQVRAAMNNEPDLAKCVRDLSFNFEQMGKTLTEQPPVMAAIELPRFWFQNVSPFVEYPPALWRLVALALRDATRVHLPTEMTVSVASWCHRFGEVAYKLASSREFAGKTLQAKGNVFAENRRDESAWRNFLAGLLVTAAYGENGRLPRSLLCQRLLEVTPPLKKLNSEQWQNAANAIVSQFRSQMDESIVSGLVESQAAVTEAFRFRKTMEQMPNTEGDVASWIHNRHKGGAQGRWRRYAAMTGQRVGMAHPAHLSVAQTLDWGLPDQAYIKAQTALYQTVFKQPLALQPGSIKVGFLKRRPPDLTDEMLAAWRVRMIGYALGVAYGDGCCQRQNILLAGLGPLREWPFDAVSELMRQVDGPIYREQGKKDNLEQVRNAILHDAWAASAIALEAKNLAQETVQRWRPFGKAGESDNERCVRDIGHVMNQVMLGCSGVPINETLAEWYEAHILGFVRESAREPFRKLPAQLDKTFRAHFPKPVADHLNSTTQPLRHLLEKD